MKTANNLSGAGTTLAQLDQLRRTIADAAKLAKHADDEFATRSNRLRAQLNQAMEGERSRWATEMDTARSDAETRSNEIESSYATRKTRISRSLTNARQLKAGLIETEEGRHTFAIQRDLLEADHVRETDTANNKSAHEAFVARLAAEKVSLEQLEADAHSTLGAYGSLRAGIGRSSGTGVSPVHLDSQRQTEPPISGKLPPDRRDACPTTATHENELVESLHTKLADASRDLSRIRALVLPLFFKFLPIWFWVIAILAVPFVFVPQLRQFNFSSPVMPKVGGIVVASLAAVFGLYFLGKKLATPPAKSAGAALDEARKLHELCAQKAEASFAAETERIVITHTSTSQMLNNMWKQKQSGAKSLREDWSERLEGRARTLRSVADGRRLHRLAQVDQAHGENVAQLAAQSSERKTQIESNHADGLAKLTATRDAAWQTIETDWQHVVVPAYKAIEATSLAAEKLFPKWEASLWKNFTLPDEFPHAARFAELSVDIERLAGVQLENERLMLPGPRRFTLPLLLDVPRNASLLFETKQSGQEQVVGALNNLVLRLFTSAPPGALAFTIFDPVGLGQNFAGIMHLADFEERLINSRIWTQQAQFEQRLADLNEHIEKVTQMYLRNEYETLAEYNAQAGRMAEKYHFLVIADFPVNFSEVAVKRLQNIAASGPRCGVHLLIHWDQRRAAPLEFVPDELRKNAVCIVPKGDGFAVASCPVVESAPGNAGFIRQEPGSDEVLPAKAGVPSQQSLSGINTWDGLKLSLDAPPDAELATRLLHQIGKDSIDSNRVEMPFAEVAPGEGEFWSLDTTNELRVPVGRTGATKLQYLSLGKGTRQHALVAGKTGSGKSTLFHVIITNLSLWCSPEQVEFYLVDFKKGVEFKCYATQKLPHARVIAIESDREFGLSVLQRVDDELKRRGDLFRKLGAQDVAGYKRATAGSGTGVSPVHLDSGSPVASEAASDSFGSPDRRDACPTTEPMPRVLLLIDEFQELFVEDDRVSQGASLLLDRIVRQGRAFGIHVILGSQTLGGAYTLARATMGQMVVRIALQCNEADAYLIMNEDNPAPRLLSRPGEAIYNDDAGTLQGNSPFQVVWLPDQVRETWLEKARELAERRTPIRRGDSEAGNKHADSEIGAPRAPIVFEGNAPADVRENPLLRAALETPATQPVTTARVWLGAPNSIKGPTEAVFRRASGNHLLIVGQRDEAALAMLGTSLISLAAQLPKQAARFFVFDCSPPDSAEAKFLELVAAIIPHGVKLVRPGDVDAVMSTLAAEQQQRADNPAADEPETFLLVHGLAKNKKLRFDEEMSFSMDAGAGANPGLLFNKLITEGAALGFHVIATCDTYNNLMRMLSRKAVSEFEMRVVFQMSSNDSASLIESPQANTLGLHRALFYNGQEGWLETFRPYALPDDAWIEEARRKLAQA